MKWVKRILIGVGSVIGLVVLFVGFGLLNLKANFPDTTFDLQPDLSASKTVLLFGATGPLGREMAADLVANGDRVIAFTRPLNMPAELRESVTANIDASDEELEQLDEDLAWYIGKQRTRNALTDLGIELAMGDVLDAATVKAAFAGRNIDATISSLGSLSAETPPDYIGNVHIHEAAIEHGARRVIYISTVGAGDSAPHAPLLSRVLLSRVLPLKTQAEDHLKESGLDYTIIRPGGLTFDAGTGNGVVSEDPSTMGFIARPDLAKLVLDILHDDRAIGKTLTAIDPTRDRPWDTDGV
jgi:uncharacterized protein YbjT (DUF2867 family)